MDNAQSAPVEAGASLDGAHMEQPAVGREIVNPVSGERIVIRQSGAQTGGRSLTFDLYLPARGHVPAAHVHPVQRERFTILEGQMRFRLGGREIVASPGETITIPAGAAHWFGAAGGRPAHALVAVRPALRMQELFESTEALGRAAPGSGSGAWSGLAARLAWVSGLARIVMDYQREVAVPHIPAPLVRLALAPLAWMARRRAKRSVTQSAPASSGGRS